MGFVARRLQISVNHCVRIEAFFDSLYLLLMTVSFLIYECQVLLGHVFYCLLRLLYFDLCRLKGEHFMSTLLLQGRSASDKFLQLWLNVDMLLLCLCNLVT